MSESAPPTGDSGPIAQDPPADLSKAEPFDETPPQAQVEPAATESSEAPAVLPEAAEEAAGEAVVARYGLLRALGLFRHDMEGPMRPGTRVVVRSERGLELAEVVSSVSDQNGPGCIERSRLEAFLLAAGAEYPFLRNGKVLRLANSQDLIDERHLEGSAREEGSYCRKAIRELNLDMKLVAVEHLLGGERIIFYFSSDSRVDFRELVRRLAAQFRTRIEMRQVGARDEAKLVGDLERCGRPCCCRSFLKYLQPISMRMAKTQKATLDPSKISGRCGRLMCCLRYEDAGYEQLRAKLPRKNTYVRTADGAVGKVTETQILAQLVRLALADNSQVVVANEEIVEQNVPPPPPPAQPSFGQADNLAARRAQGGEAQAAARTAEPPARAAIGPDRPSAAQTAPAGADSERQRAGRQAPYSQGPREEAKQPRQDEEEPTAAAGPETGQQQQAQTSGGQGGPAAGESRGKRRRRRRRRRR